MGSSDTARYIRTVARYRSISIAADELGISQPALSARLRKVEDQVGTPLFDRSRLPLAITEAGRAYLACQDEIDAARRRLERRLSDLADLEAGSLVFGGAAFFNSTVLPPVVAAFERLHPKVSLSIVDSTVPELTQGALEGKVDLFIAPSVSGSADLSYEELLEERVFLCVPPEVAARAQLPSGAGSSPARIGEAEGKRLEGETFVKLSSTLQIGQKMDALFGSWGIRPKRIVRTDQMFSGLMLTLAGVGCSLVTESAFGNFPLREMPPCYLPDEGICTRRLYIAHARGATYSAAAREFARLLREHAAGLGTGQAHERHMP